MSCGGMWRLALGMTSLALGACASSGQPGAGGGGEGDGELRSRVEIIDGAQFAATWGERCGHGAPPDLRRHGAGVGHAHRRDRRADDGLHRDQRAGGSHAARGACLRASGRELFAIGDHRSPCGKSCLNDGARPRRRGDPSLRDVRPRVPSGGSAAMSSTASWYRWTKADRRARRAPLAASASLARRALRVLEPSRVDDDEVPGRCDQAGAVAGLLGDLDPVVGLSRDLVDGLWLGMDGSHAARRGEVRRPRRPAPSVSSRISAGPGITSERGFFSDSLSQRDAVLCQTRKHLGEIVRGLKTVPLHEGHEAMALSNG